MNTFLVFMVATTCSCIISLQMVATDEAPSTQNTLDAGGTFGKLKQTLSSSLLTAQDRGKNL